MPGNELLRLLQDREVLLEAHAASSAYVMRRAFEGIKELKAFRGRTDLAPAILARLQSLSKEPRDPVMLGAHLYALELTGSHLEIGKGVSLLLEKRPIFQDPLLGQFAGSVGATLARMTEKLVPGTVFQAKDLEAILKALKGKGGPS
jgi:hypothetical protein